MLSTILFTALKSLVLILLLIGGFAYVMLFERKLLGWFQMRLGPNTTGPWGLLQPIADGVKLILKEDIVPENADRRIFLIAPIISVFTALAVWAVIPVGVIRWQGEEIQLSISDPNAGILTILALTSLGVYGIALAGWSSQNKYALLGSLRSTAQMISYELAMGMSLVGVFVLAGSLRLTDIVAAQASWPYALLQPLGFAIYFITAVAETNRAPFDLPEAETELVAGYHTDYSGFRFAMFFIAEYVNMITVSALTVLLYLGGWLGPSFLPGIVWFLLKVAAVLFVFIWIRATLPRLRYDRLMSFGWKVLLPLAVLNLVITAIMVAL